MLHAIPLVITSTRREADDLAELLTYVRDYHTAIRCVSKQKEAGNSSSRQMELAAYFTHCKLQQVHLILALRQAMNLFWKHGQKQTCGTFCRRLLDLNPGDKVGVGWLRHGAWAILEAALGGSGRVSATTA